MSDSTWINVRKKFLGPRTGDLLEWVPTERVFDRNEVARAVEAMRWSRVTEPEQGVAQVAQMLHRKIRGGGGEVDLTATAGLKSGQALLGFQCRGIVSFSSGLFNDTFSETLDEWRWVRWILLRETLDGDKVWPIAYWEGADAI